MALPKISIALGAVLLAAGAAAGFFAAKHSGVCAVPKSAEKPSFTATASDPAATSVSLQIGTQAQPAASAAVPAPVDPNLSVSMNAIGLQEYFRSLNESNAGTYVVKAGDNLTRISELNGVTVGQILAASGLTDPNKLQVGMKLKIMREKFDVVVDKSAYTLYLRAAGKTVQTYPIGLGKDNSTPIGAFKVVNKLKNPTWYHSGKVVPFGDPENPLGTRWLGFDIKGYGLHGTIEPESIGKSESMGCVRMQNEHVEALYELLSVGTPITIVEKLGAARQ